MIYGKRSRPYLWAIIFCILCGVLAGIGIILILAVKTPAASAVSVVGHSNSTTTTCAVVSTSSVSTPSHTTASITTAPSEKVLLAAPLLCQHPEYPTGCEATAAVMALRYSGNAISIAEFIDRYIPCSRSFYQRDGKSFGPSPYDYFLGNPREKHSYGCMAPVIEKALTQCLGDSQRVKNVTGSSLQELCQQYINSKTPVIVWATINMSPVLRGNQWYLPDGTRYTWPSGEHCLLLVGYDTDSYYFNDPTTGKVVPYGRTITEQRYKQMGMQALVITNR